MPWSILPALSTNYDDVSSPSRPGPLKVLFLPPGMLARFYAAAHSLDFSSQKPPCSSSARAPTTLSPCSSLAVLLTLKYSYYLLSVYPCLLTEQLGAVFIFQLVQGAEHLKRMLFFVEHRKY